MRPPDHWHLRRRRPAWLRWALALTALLVVIVALVLWCRPSGGETEHSSVTGECPAGADCSQVGGTPLPADEVLAPQITGRAAAVVEDSCGALLYGRNADERLPPASLAKIATALVAVERADLNRMVEVRVNSGLLVASTASTVMGLQSGMRLSMRDLLYGLLLPSGNDAAIAIAQEVAGSVPAFVDLMNDKAAVMGLQNTHFANPHGLDETGLYTSAFDIAMLGRALLRQPDLAAIVSTKQYQPAWDGPELWNGNALLDLYPEAVGVKIGYTEKAGQTIVAAADRGGRRLIVSVLGGWDRYTDAITLFEWAFANTTSPCLGPGALSEAQP
jgi:D-alanyl-D-alanine carboxypeptidase (penicillin-binding protein 5/6)